MDDSDWRTLVESLPQIVWVTRPDGWHEHFNRQWTEFTGLTFEQIRDWGWLQFIHPDDVDESAAGGTPSRPASRSSWSTASAAATARTGGTSAAPTP